MNSSGRAHAPFVQVVADTHPPTAPANPTATGSVNAVRVTWDASTDNASVVRYDVYRSTLPNFVPSASNRVGQSASTSFLDSGVAPGTSVFVTVSDANGAPLAIATNVAFSQIASGGTSGYHAMYFAPNTAGSVSTGDVLRLSTTTYPTGYQVQIVSGSSVVYTHALQ